MTVTRVGSYTLFENTINNAARVQNRLFELQNQISSGLKSTDFEGINGSVEQFTILDSRLQRTEQFLENNKISRTRLNQMDTVLGAVVDIASSFEQLLTLRRNNVTVRDGSFPQQVVGFYQAFASQLNNSIEGRYVFSGTRTDTPPLDDGAFPSLQSEGVPDAGYYNGSNENTTIRVQDGFEIEQTVRADNAAFQKVVAAFVLAQEGDAQNDDEKLAQATDMLNEGLEGVIGLQANVRTNTVIIEQAADRQDGLRLFWQGIKEELVNTDLVSASTEVANSQATLQASFLAFSRINSLSLTNFLS